MAAYKVKNWFLNKSFFSRKNWCSWMNDAWISVGACLHWRLPHPSLMSCWAGLVSGSGFEFTCTVQCCEWFISGAATAHCSHVEHSGNTQHKWIHQNPALSYLINGAHTIFLSHILVCCNFTALMGGWQCFFYPLPLPWASYKVLYSPHTCCA